MAKLSTTSLNVLSENLEKLHQLFPQFVKDNQIDFDALKAFFEKEGALPDFKEKYGLGWAGKSRAFELIKTPATGTLIPQENESKDWDTTENIFIEGDNLEVLKLLQKHYREKIKMIYIDPPYNTGKDFIYEDNFREGVSDYYERTGQNKNGIPMTTNRDSSGRYHSNWLTMMYPRLFLAKNLLKNDGVIFVSIDDNEVANLRLIMDEIFGEENFICQLIWNSSTGGGIRSKFVNYAHQYVLVYGKNLNLMNQFWAPLSEAAIDQYNKEDKKGIYREKDFAWKNSSNNRNQKYEIKCPDGSIIFPKDGYILRFIKPRFEEELDKDSVIFKKTKNGPFIDKNGKQAKWNIYIKKYLGEGKGAPVSVLPKSLVGLNNEGTSELEELFGYRVFENPKNVRLINYLLSFGSDKDSIILDFFAGSGTTAHSVIESNSIDNGNRKWICVQLPESVEQTSEALKASYKNIAQISKDRIRRAGKKILAAKKDELRKEKMNLDVGFKAFLLSNSTYRHWNILNVNDGQESFKKQMKLILDKPLIDGYEEKSAVYEILLKEGFGLNSTVTKERLNDFDYWLVREAEKRMIIAFAQTLNRTQIEHLGLSAQDIFVCFDSALNDSIKVSISKNVNFKTI